MDMIWQKTVMLACSAAFAAAAFAQAAPPALSASASASASPSAPSARTECPSEPATAALSKKDGQYAVRSDLSSNGERDIAGFVLIGKEAAASGRPRDAEVAFLMSCRLADKFKGLASPESIDARYQLARHYAQVALHSGANAGPNRGELLRRAEALYLDSLSSYRARHGEKHEKSRFAAEGLASVRTALAQSEKAASRVAQSPRPAAPGTTRPAMATPSAVRPSFDCAKARSTPEKMICADPELAQLDRELGRLHARAKSSAVDSAAFKRQNDSEWRRREATCRDRECLTRWYADRRAQLIAGMNGDRTSNAGDAE